MFEHGSTSVSRNFQRCGTCRYWGGKKKCCNDLVEYDMYEKADCGCFTSPAYSKEMMGDDYCFSHLNCNIKSDSRA